MASDVSVQTVGRVLEPGTATSSPETKPGYSKVSVSKPGAIPAIVFIKPALKFDPLFGLVIIEFRDQSGNVRKAIPTLHQLETYREWSVTHQDPNARTLRNGGSPAHAP
jgi:hypothetical protein